PQTITVTTGLMKINRAMSIIGPSAKVTINGNTANGYFSIGDFNISCLAVNISNLAMTNFGVDVQNFVLSLSNLTVSNAEVYTEPEASLTIQDSTFSNHSFAVYATGPLTLNDCTFDRSSASGFNLTATDCRFENQVGLTPLRVRVGTLTQCAFT